MVSLGRVVILNGASSAGKSTLATSFQEREAEHGRLWVITALDDYLGKVPPDWHALGDLVGPFSADGMRFVSRDGAVDVQIGPAMHRVLAGYRAGVAAMARCGVDVLVDEVVLDETCWNGWVSALSGADARWVGIRCSDAVLEEREQARGDRFPGLARSLNALVHRYPSYDLEIDTSVRTIEQAVDDLSAHLAAR